MERDRFAWMMKNCEPTAAQRAELATCPFTRESEDYEEFSPSPSQSPAPTPMTPIRMVSLPTTQCSADPFMAGEDAVFHTPPEHHVDSSLEDQNPNDMCAEKATISETKTGSVVDGEEFDGDTVPLGETEVVETEGDGGVGFDGDTVPLGETEVVDESEGDGGVGFDGDTVPLGETEVDESEGDGGVGFDGDTVPLGETEVDETEEDGGVGSTRVLSDEDLEIASWLDEWYATNKAASAAMKREIGGLMNNGAEIENVESIGGEEPNETSDSSGSSVSCEIIGYKSCEIESGAFEKSVEIAESAEKTARDGRKRKLSPSKEKDAEGSCEIVGETHSGGLEKSVEMSKYAEESAEDGHGNGGVRGNRKSCKGKAKEAGDSCEIVGYKRCETESGGLEKGFEIAKSAEKSVEDGHGNGGRKRKLPPSCTGKEKDAGESSEKQSGSTPLIKEKGKDVGGSSKKKLSMFLGFLMKHFEYKRNDNEDDEDDDFIATAKKRGMNFPTPRIWKRL